MAAPDMPQPARAPHLPQNSAEFHHDDEEEDEEEELEEEPEFLSLNLRVVVDTDDHRGKDRFVGTRGARCSRTRQRSGMVLLLDDEACRVDVFAVLERRSCPNLIIVGIRLKLNYSD